MWLLFKLIFFYGGLFAMWSNFSNNTLANVAVVIFIVCGAIYNTMVAYTKVKSFFEEM